MVYGSMVLSQQGDLSIFILREWCQMLKSILFAIAGEEVESRNEQTNWYLLFHLKKHKERFLNSKEGFVIQATKRYVSSDSY